MRKKLDPTEAKAQMLNAGFIPLTEYPGIREPWECQCAECGKVSMPSLHSVKSYKTKCAYCSRVRVDPVDAIRIMKASKIEPLEDYPGSAKVWRSKCLVCEKIIFPRFNRVNQGKGGCINCGRKNANNTQIEKTLKKVLLGIENLDLEIVGEFKGSSYDTTFKCKKCNRELVRKPLTLLRNKSGCSFCSGYRIDDTEALKKLIGSGYNPIGERPSDSRGKWKSVHIKCGRVVYPTLSNIIQGHGACRYCAKFGIDMKKPGYLYLMVNEDFNSYKVGVGGYSPKRDRIKDHQKSNWQLIDRWEFASGEDALEAEAQFFVWIRTVKNLPIHLSKEFMKQGGWTETFSTEEITTVAVINQVKSIIKGLEYHPVQRSL